MTSKYRLISVNPFPATCQACGRECPERHLVVADETGTTMRLGASCAWKVAGVKPTDRIQPIEVETTDEERRESLDALLSWMS